VVTREGRPNGHATQAGTLNSQTDMISSRTDNDYAQALDVLIPAPGLREYDSVELALPIDEAWNIIRHSDLADAPLIRSLFALRTLPSRVLHRAHEPFSVRIDDIVSTNERPGFAVLVDDPPHTVAVAAIGKVWEPNIEFVHVGSASEFAEFTEPGYVRVAWSLSLTPLDDRVTNLGIEVRVDATDAQSWRHFRQYFRLIGPPSRFIRHRLLRSLDHRYGAKRAEHDEVMPGDELLTDAVDQMTHAVTIRATPETIWPWLVQMGCRRAGFYSIDLFDNGGQRSAREIHPEFQHLAVGDIVAATPEGEDGFEVLAIAPNRVLVLGGLFDPEHGRQLPFHDPRPERYWHITWAFILQPRADGTTRLIVRTRAALDPSKAFHAKWIRPVHHLMETTQLRHLAARVEGRVSNDDWRDIAAGTAGAAVVTAAMLTPFLRTSRSHWGVDDVTAARSFPGDDLVSTPQWQWTHGVDIEAASSEVWPWVAQIGADRGGFYSYQWLENLPGCDLRNAEAIHPDWELKRGDALFLHPKMAPLSVTEVERGRYFVAHAAPQMESEDGDEHWANVSWLFFIQSLGDRRSRLISRYRCATSDDLATRLQFGPTFIEPIGFAMDRAMLLGIKTRVEHTRT
jgi:hypothetical protein